MGKQWRQWHCILLHQIKQYCKMDSANSSVQYQCIQIMMSKAFRWTVSLCIFSHMHDLTTEDHNRHCPSKTIFLFDCLFDMTVINQSIHTLRLSVIWVKTLHVIRGEDEFANLIPYRNKFVKFTQYKHDLHCKRPGSHMYEHSLYYMQQRLYYSHISQVMRTFGSPWEAKMVLKRSNG